MSAAESNHLAPPMDGPRIRRLRRRLGLTQQQFAEQLHVTPLTVLRWESRQSTPRRLALKRLQELEAEAPVPAVGGAAAAELASSAAPPALDFAGNPEAVLAVAEAQRLAFGHQFNPAFASEISRIDPLPHQRIAVYERILAQDPIRFLLADDAGAGKTIMTGLAVREMLGRGRIRRVLIVPPAGLVGNWERELRTLFQLSFRIVSGADARAGNPFGGEGSDLAIVSLDTLAGEGVFDRLRSADTPAYDLAVFDEAHKLAAATDNHRTRKTRRYRLAEALAGCAAPDGDYAGLRWCARHLLLLTATPHMGKDSPYHHLWRLLDPQVFATGEACRRFPQQERGRHFIRRTKEEMVGLDGRPLYRQRFCDTFSYDLSAGAEGEQALYDATSAYLSDIYDRILGNQGAARLALGVFQRRLASSSWALLRSLERRAEKLRRTIAELQDGSLNSSDLLRRQRDLDRRHRTDYFDERSADEDAAGEDGREASEGFETEVLGAVVAVTIEDLQSELQTLGDLSARARAILDSGNESKFEKLREVLEAPRHAQEKWLIFTEHRDTLDYLVRRLEGLGHAGRVAQVHGGMAWPEREREVQRFRRADGARYLVATDAAGEGINLQFCALMANYDIPWNPARLEQRMGRIHRYGQQRDVYIVNLVAASTREGRVLQVLLEKLEAIRRQLRSDKVFDVIGRLFQNASLKDYMIEALTEAGERSAKARIGEALAGERVADIRAAEEKVYGAGGEVAARLDGLCGDLERERYVQLLPGYVRRFVEKSAALLGLNIHGDLDGHFSLAPQRSGALDGLLPALERYSPTAQSRLCIHRAEQGAEGIWLHPGEPVFDALAEQVLSRFSQDALRGAIFIDPKADAPYLFHLAIATVQSQADEGAAPQVLERRLLGVRQEADGEPVESAIDPLLLLHGAGHIAPGAVPLAGRGIGMRADAARFLNQLAQAQCVERRREALRAALPERRSRLAAGFDLQAAELAARRTRLAHALAKDEDGDASELEAAKQAQRALAAQKSQAFEALEAAPERIALGEVRFLLHALAVPATDADEAERYDERIEEMAVRIASAWERQRGAEVRDVSKPTLARAAGLPDWPGFDLLSLQPGSARGHPSHEGSLQPGSARGHPSHEKSLQPGSARGHPSHEESSARGHPSHKRERCIEVKGRAGRGAVQMEANEWKQACHLGGRYWLYVVFDCATPSPQLVRVRDPFHQLLANSRGTSAYSISAKSLLEAADG